MQKELLSAYMDGEQINAELTQALCQDKNLQQSWANFHHIRAVIRNEADVFLGTDFTAKMDALIEKEEIMLTQPTVSQPEPEETTPPLFMQKLKSWFAPVAQVAIAASVCLVAVLGVQSFNAKTDESNVADIPVLQTLPFNNSVQEVSYNAPSKDVITPEQLEQKNKRISSMLQSYELQRRVYSDALSLGQPHSK